MEIDNDTGVNDRGVLAHESMYFTIAHTYIFWNIVIGVCMK